MSNTTTANLQTYEVVIRRQVVERVIVVASSPERAREVGTLKVAGDEVLESETVEVLPAGARTEVHGIVCPECGEFFIPAHVGSDEATHYAYCWSCGRGVVWPARAAEVA